MGTRKRSVADVPSTPHFNFVYGTFQLSKWTIPYFSTAMTLVEAADHLCLASELPGGERINWKLSELYQRDVDWPRVERKIVPYLRNPENPQFFNALTIALLPYDRDAGSLLQSYDQNHVWNVPPLEEPSRFEKTVQKGPITIGYWEDWDHISSPGAQTGQMRWNPQEVFAVALDGQHRLAAIKTLKPAGSQPAPNLERTRVPVILLIFDPSLGYSAPASNPVVEVLRILFIDLNKHARTVSRARQILLDDRDPHSVCVRTTVGEQLSDHTDDLNNDPPRLPLSLVDWHSEQAKFDAGPYVSTVLGLDWITSLLLSTKPLADYTDYRAVRDQIAKIGAQLGVDLSGAQQRVSDLEGVSLSPFAYHDIELEQISAAFARVWARPLVHLFTAFQPYAALVKKRHQLKAFSMDFTSWYQLYERKQQDKFDGRATFEYRQLMRRLSERAEAPLGESALIDKLNKIDRLKEGSLAFNVVFQRAYFDALVEFIKIKSGATSELQEDDEPDEAPDLEDSEDDGGDEEVERCSAVPPPDQTTELADHTWTRAEAFVGIMNRLAKALPEFLDVDCEFKVERREHRFWLGTLRKPEGGIDFTQGASKRAKDLIFLCVAMCLYDDLMEPEEESDFDDFWNSMVHDDEGPSFMRRMFRAVRRFADKENVSAGARILKAKEEDFSIETSREEIYWRMSFVWQQLGL